MRLKLIFQLFVRASQLQKKRAILTVAAIAWGTVAILLLLSFGEGLKNQMMKGPQGHGREPRGHLARRDLQGVEGPPRRAPHPPHRRRRRLPPEAAPRAGGASWARSTTGARS